VDDRGAERAVQIRRQQARERAALQADIAKSQAEIAAINQQRAPVAAELRKVEAEVGPIKYIAALIYGDDPDANLLEKAVRWVIILLVVVFDPLAIMMVLAATESLKWHRETLDKPAYPPDDGPLTDDQLDEIQAAVDEFNQTQKSKSIFEQHPYLTKGFAHFKDLKPMVAPVPTKEMPESQSTLDNDQDSVDDDIDDDEPQVKAAMREWKRQHLGQTVKHQRELLDQGRIDQLPWMAYIKAVPDAGANMYRGTEFPVTANKGDGFVKLDSRPTRIYKHNGIKWIEVDKALSDLYSYDVAYIDWLIERISAGEYDPDLLTDSEQDQIAERINQTKGN
jgi:hypothetical protein